MNGFSILVWLTMAQLPAVEVATLAGDQHQGTLVSFASDAVVVKTESKSISIPVGELLLIRSTRTPAKPATDSQIEIRLVDNTRIRVNSVASSGTVVTAVHSRLGELRFPAATVASIRLAPADLKIDSEWIQLVDRTLKKDVVAVRKGDVLDHLDGVIGTLNDSTLQFQLDGDDIPIKREKVFGLIYSKRESTAKKAIAQLELTTGDRLAVRQIALNGTIWKTKLVSGMDVEISSELFQSLDYSLGKVTYLSDLEPRTVKHVPFHEIPLSFAVNEYRRDMDFDGNRISLFDKPNQRTSYAKGLAIHSRNLLKYRLGGEYRRFQAIMGIGAEIPNGEVDVVIKGDNRILFEGTVKAMETDDKASSHRAISQMLDLDVAGVVEFEIDVDWGHDRLNSEGQTIKANDIGDRLYLANARVIK